MRPIAVRSPNWIGDCIMCLPAIRALKEFCPHDPIVLVCKSYLQDVYRNLPEIDRLITIPNKSNCRGFFQGVRKLKDNHCRAGILFTNSFHSALLFRLAGIRETIGYEKDGRGFLLSRKIKFPNDDRHHSTFYLDLAAAFAGKDITHSYPDDLVVLPGEKEAVGELLSSQGVKMSSTLIGISPSAAYGTAKQWLPERFSELIRKITREIQPASILLFGSPKEYEKIENIRLAGEDNRRVFNVSKCLTLRETMAAISMCRVFIGNDSGLMHIASSLKVPLVALYGPNLPKKTGPLYAPARVFHYPVECSPCLHRDCPTDHRCMTAIDSDDVFAAVRDTLG